MVGHAHALAWAGLLLLAWPLQVDGTTWTGPARLSADVTAPLLVFVLLLFGGQLRALWVTVTIGANGIRVRTGPVGRAIHRHWDQIGAVEVLDEELPADSLVWARRFERRYVLRPGPVLRIRQPELHLPAITVSINDADQAAAVAARHLADHTHRY